jgi:uncharacterized membrane protein
MPPPAARSHIRRYLITGLLVWVPIVITVWVLSILVGTMDNLLPEVARPEHWLGVYIPGLGVILTLLVVFLTGVFAANVLGQRLMNYWERALARIPVVNSIYKGVKQVSDTLLTPGGQAFRRALLVQWPNAGTWTIAFLTGRPGGDVANHLVGDYVSVYVPTTPNPTGGYFVMLPRSAVIELDMTVDEALKYIISMGVVAPSPRLRRGAPSAAQVPVAAPEAPSAPQVPAAAPEAQVVSR